MGVPSKGAPSSSAMNQCRFVALRSRENATALDAPLHGLARLRLRGGAASLRAKRLQLRTSASERRRRLLLSRRFFAHKLSDLQARVAPAFVCAQCHRQSLRTHAERAGFGSRRMERKNLCIWDRNNRSDGGFACRAAHSRQPRIQRERFAMKALYILAAVTLATAGVAVAQTAKQPGGNVASCRARAPRATPRQRLAAACSCPRSR